MNFLAPAAFLFAIALPVVVLFYLLKRKRVVRLTSSTVLWQRFLAETQASSPFQRLRHNWLLLLQLLILILAVLALARPYFSGEVSGGRLLVAILDASASMQSTDEPPSRFERARNEALGLIDSLHDNDQMVVLQAGAGARVLQSATTEKASLRRAVQAAQVSDSITQLTEALKMAESLTRDNSAAEVHLFSDGAAVGMDDLENRGLNLVYHRIGQTARNAGIVNLDLRPNPEDPSQRAIFAAIANAADETRQADVELWFNGRMIETRPVTLAPTNTVSIVFLASQLADGVFEVRLGGTDDLAVDDRAFLVSRLPQPVRVLLVTAGNRFLERALRTAGQVELTVVPSLTDPDPPFDLVVLDGVTPLTWPPLNVLAIQTLNTNWFQGVTAVEAPTIVDWKSTHPLMRYVSLDNVVVSRSVAVPPPDWGERVIDAAQTPLLVAGDLGRQRIAWLAFDVLESTWPLRVSFPIFVANAVDWLNPATLRAAQQRVPAGMPFRMPLEQPLNRVEVTSPDGTTHPIPLDPSATELIYGNTDRQGVYQIRWENGETTFAVNLLSEAETRTQPREALDLGKFGTVAAATTRRASVEVWRWIALGALGIMMFEWWFYHRRTA